jgi:hypothetical protein
MGPEAEPLFLNAVTGQNITFVNYLDYTKLKSWIADVFGDQELANAIGAEIEKSKSLVECIDPIKQLIEERLKQCKALIKHEPVVPSF